MQELALLLGIITAEWISLYPSTLNSSGYFWPALRDAVPFLLPALAARWAISWIFLQLSLLSDYSLFHSWPWAVVVGLTIASLPVALERFLDSRATAKLVSGRIPQILLRFNLLTGLTFRSAIQKLKEQDNYDCQHSQGWWNLGLSERQINRRLRILYEKSKPDIACRYKNPALLHHDVNVSPAQKFYLLVAHLGRKGLKSALEKEPSSPPPGQDWDGTERRRRVGSKTDRKIPDPNPYYSRIYDYEEIIAKVRKGEVLDFPIRIEEILPIPYPPNGLVAACLANECFIYVGAGLSAASGYPLWYGLVEGILEWALEGGYVPQDLGESLRAALGEGDANLVADAVIGNLRGREDLLYHHLKKLFLENGRDLSPSHQLLQEIPFAGALTTNFDELLENTFGEDVHVYTPEDPEPLREDLAGGRFFLLKLYGSLQRPSTLVVSPAQYQESIEGNRAFSRAMEGLFFSRTILFVGASLQDIETYLGGLALRGVARRQHYALVAVTGTAWRAKADLLSRRYGIQVMPYRLSTSDHPEVLEFLTQLRDRIKTEAKISSPQGKGPELLQRKSQPLTRVRLENIGAFEELDIELNPRWTLLLGDNGVGKTTILEAIATAISGKDAEPFAGHLIRTESRVARIVLTAGTHEYMATLLTREDKYTEIEMTPSRPLETEGWLAIGFPPLRTVTRGNSKGPGPEGKRRPTSEDLLPLVRGRVDPRLDEFKQWIVNLDYWRKSAPSGFDNRYISIRDQFFEMLQELTQGVPVRFKRVNEFTHQVIVETDDGEVPIEAVSQGAVSLMGWTGFLLQRLYEVYGDQDGDPQHRHALVLVDEIDAHMHPVWQQALVERLTHVFEGVQFVATTHSPFIAGSLAPTSIWRLRRENKKVMAERPLASFKGWRVDQILTSPLFGLETGRESETQRLLLRYTELAAQNNLDEVEQREMADAAAALKIRMPTSAERAEARKAFELLEKTMRQWIESMSIEEQEKILAEAKVQLQEAITGSRRPQ